MKRPIRKRGYYRALKRGELWAVVEARMRQLMDQVGKQFFEIYDPLKPTPFLEYLERSKR